MAGVFGLSDFRVEQLEGNVEESANYGYIWWWFSINKALLIVLIFLMKLHRHQEII